MTAPLARLPARARGSTCASRALAATLALGAAFARTLADTPPVPSPPATTAPAAPKEGPPVPPPKPAETSKSTPQHFEPTEKTRADFEVSFPVDI